MVSAAPLRALVAGTFFLAAIQVLVVAVSLAGLSFSRGLAVATGVTALLAAMAAARAVHEEENDGATSDPVGRMAGGLVAAWGLSVWLRLVWIAVRRPVQDWDGLYYHVPALHAWVQAGRVHWIAGFEDLPFANGYPMGAEVLSFWVHFLTGSSRFVATTNLLLWPLGAVALVVVARELGARRGSGWLASAAWALSPAFLGFAATGYADPAFACAAAAFLAFALRWVRRGPRTSRVEMLGLGAALGLVVATKGTGLVLGTAFGAAAYVAYARRHEDLPRRVALPVLIALAVGGVWTLRNLWYTNNPIFPLDLPGGGPNGYDARAMVDLNLPDWLRSWPEGLRPLRAWWPRDPRGAIDAAEMMRLGYVWSLAAIPTALFLSLAARRFFGPRWPWVAALVVLMLQPGPWWGRLTLWLLALGVPLVAVGFDRAPALGRVLLGAVLLLGVFDAERWLGRTLREAEAQHREGVTSLALFAPGLADREEFRPFLDSPHIARGPWSRFGTLLGGALCLPLDARRIDVIGAAPDVEEVQSLREAGVEWVVWDRGGAGELPAVFADLPQRQHVRGEELDLVLIDLSGQSE